MATVPISPCGSREAMLQLFCSNLDCNHGALHTSLVLGCMVARSRHFVLCFRLSTSSFSLNWGHTVFWLIRTEVVSNTANRGPIHVNR